MPDAESIRGPDDVYLSIPIQQSRRLLKPHKADLLCKAWQQKATKICPSLTRRSPRRCRFSERAGWAGVIRHPTLVMYHPARSPRYRPLTQPPSRTKSYARALAQSSWVGLQRWPPKSIKGSDTPLFSIFCLRFFLFINEDCDFYLYLLRIPPTLLSDTLRIWADTKRSQTIYRRNLSPMAISKEHTCNRQAASA